MGYKCPLCRCGINYFLIGPPKLTYCQEKTSLNVVKWLGLAPTTSSLTVREKISPVNDTGLGQMMQVKGNKGNLGP
jgi:hypothetical protein